MCIMYVYVVNNNEIHNENDVCLPENVEGVYKILLYFIIILSTSVRQGPGK